MTAHRRLAAYIRGPLQPVTRVESVPDRPPERRKYKMAFHLACGHVITTNRNLTRIPTAKHCPECDLAKKPGKA